jgi:hypothetical protein
MYALGITFLENDFEQYFCLVYNIRWIFAVSKSYHLLENFSKKIKNFTSLQRKNFIILEIIPLHSISQQEVLYNNMQHPYYLDKIYVEGIVNLNDGLSFNYNEFRTENWLF